MSDPAGKAKLRNGVSTFFELDLLYGGRTEFYIRGAGDEPGLWRKQINRDRVAEIRLAEIAKVVREVDAEKEGTP